MTEDTRDPISDAHEAAQGDTTKAVLRRIHELRGGRRWSAAYLAERMTVFGVPWTQEVVFNLSRGKRKAITVDELVALSLVFEVPIPLLLGGPPFGVLEDRIAQLEVAVFGDQA